MTTPITFEALGFDPAPGAVDQVGQLATRYRRVSDKLGAALDALNTIAEQRGIWAGAAAEAFGGNIDRLPEYLGKAVDSTAAASDALDEWTTSLRGLQQRAVELEKQARQARDAAEAARNDPAFDLANRTYYDMEALAAAQRMLDAAADRLNGAIENVNAIQEAAQRLLGEHGQAAEGIAHLLDEARELAPDKPGGIGNAIGGAISGAVGAVGGALDVASDAAEGVGDLASDAVDGVGDLASGALDSVGNFLEDNANVIAAASRIVGDVSMVVGMAGDLPIPVVGEALSAVATGMDAVALGGLMVADHYGADVSDGEIMMAGLSLTASALGIIPGVPSTLVEGVGAAALAADVGPYMVPQNGRQWAEMGASVLFPGLRTAVVAENMATDFGSWGEELHDAAEADQAARGRG